MATGRTNRLALDENLPTQAGKDVDTRKGPILPLAAPYGLFVAHVVNGAVASIADWVSVRIQVTSQSNKDGDRYLDRTQTTLNPSLTDAQWQAGTASHAVFSLTGADTNFSPWPCGGPLYYVLTATLQNEQVVPLGYGSLNVDRAHQNGTNIELAKAGDNFPLVSLSAVVTQGPLGAEWIPKGPNQFQLALSIPLAANPITPLSLSTASVFLSNAGVTLDQLILTS